MTDRQPRNPRASAQAALPFDHGVAPADAERRQASPDPGLLSREVNRPGHPFVVQLADLCRMHPTRAKWVFVPSHALGYTLGDRLARDGTNWVNLRFVTPLEIAIRMAGPFLVERGIDPSEESLGPPLMMRLLETPGVYAPAATRRRGTTGATTGAGEDHARAPEGPTEPYFQPLARHTSLAVALWTTLRELRFAGVRAGDLVPDGFESAAKHAELVALLRAYEDHLADNRLADMPAVLEEAPTRVDFCPVLAADVRIEFPDVIWAPLVRRFLDALPGEPIVAETIALAGLDLPRRMHAFGPPSHRRPVAATSDASRLRHLRDPAAAGMPVRDGSLRVFHAGGRDAEIDEVFRQIVTSGRRLDEVEVVCASQTHALVAWEKARRLDWPVTIASGVPATFTRPGRALLAWCRWVEGGFAAGDLRRLLQSGDMAPAAFEGLGTDAGDTGEAAAEEPVPDGSLRAPALSALTAARLLLRAEAAWGRDTYSRSLTAYAAREEARARIEDDASAEWRTRRAAQARQLLEWVEGLLHRVPEEDERGEVALAHVLDAARSFVEANAARIGDIDAAAHVALLDAIDNLQSMGEARCSRELGLGFLQEAVEREHVGAARARPGHLHISQLSDHGPCTRAFVFVVGLEEAGVFPTAVEDPILLDAEREAIGTRLGRPELLRTSRDRLDEAVFAAVSRLAAIGVDVAACACVRRSGDLGVPRSAVVLSFSSVDTREFRGTFPSWLILQALRIQQGNPGLTYEDLHRLVGEPVSVVPPRAEHGLTSAGWWLHHARAANAHEAVLAAFPNLARGLDASDHRGSDSFTQFDGLVVSAGRALDPVRRAVRGVGGYPVSPTTLEDAAKCPFRFFLKHGLGLQPVDDSERDADVWLDALRRGAELHDLYALVTRRARAAGRRVSRSDDLEWLLERGRERLDDLRREMPPPSEEVYAAESRELLDDLVAFVHAEEGLRDVTPMAFEVAFGTLGTSAGMTTDAAADDEPLSSEAPVEVQIDAQTTLSVHGRIDRIDRIGPHEYQVVDYKTGRFWSPDFNGEFVGGTLLQHALYGRAAAVLLAQIDPGARVARGIYWFPTGRGWGRRIAKDAPGDAALAAVVRDLVDIIASGTFLQSPDRRICDWCDFAAACGREPWTTAGRKVDGGDARLGAWTRLKARR